MFKQLSAFLEASHYFHDNQSGFRGKYSTKHAVIDLVEHIRAAIDRGYVTVEVFIDFSVAFNSHHTSYILSTLLAAWLAKVSAYGMADSFAGRRFAIIKADGYLTPCYDYSRGFVQVSRGGVLFYNSC